MILREVKVDLGLLANEMNYNNSELTKYYKQIILKNIGIRGQKKISQSKVLIVGVGGLGCPLLMYLANCGVGTIGLVDNDKVELSNLNRQILFDSRDIGKYKVIQAKRRINSLDKKIKIITFKERINKKNIRKILSQFDIICDGTDNFLTRYLINDFCKKKKKILITAAISKFDGQLFNFNFKKKTPCFRCFMPDDPKNNLNCDSEGISPPVAGIFGTLIANEVITSILKLKSYLHGNVLIFDALKTNFRKIKLNINSNCINQC